MVSAANNPEGGGVKNQALSQGRVQAKSLLWGTVLPHAPSPAQEMCGALSI